MPRKQSATVQLKVRVKEPVRANAERRARRRGVSLNQEIGDCLEQARLLDVLTEGTLTLRDLTVCNGHVLFAKRATVAAGRPEDEWIEWTRDVPFPIDPDNGDALAAAYRGAAAAVDAELERLRSLVGARASTTEERAYTSWIDETLANRERRGT